MLLLSHISFIVIWGGLAEELFGVDVPLDAKVNVPSDSPSIPKLLLEAFPLPPEPPFLASINYENIYFKMIDVKLYLDARISLLAESNFFVYLIIIPYLC